VPRPRAGAARPRRPAAARDPGTFGRAGRRVLARARAEAEALEARAADAEAGAADRDAAVARAEALEQRVADLRAEQAPPRAPLPGQVLGFTG